MYVIISIIYLIAGLQSFLIYNHFKLEQYIVFSFIFIAFGLDTFLISYGFEDTPVELFVFIVYMMLFHYINLSLTNSPIIFSGIKWKGFIGFIGLGVLISFILEPNWDVMLYIRYLLSDILISYMGLEVVLTQRKIDIPHPTRKIKMGQIAWVLLGTMATLLGILRSTIFTYLSLDTLFNSTSVSIENSLILKSSLFVTLTYGLFGFIMLLIVFYIPESLVASKHQLMIVYELYKLIETENSKKRTSELQFHYFSVDYVKDYLESINFDKIIPKSNHEK